MADRFWIPIVFFGLTAWFFLDPGSALPAIPPAAHVAPGELDPGPRRSPLGDPPMTEVGGYVQRCSACHDLFETPEHREGPLLQHTHVVLDHGVNDRCLNCHSRDDRDKLVLHGEVRIGFDRVVELCAKCHGPTWRDWQAGTHGKTLGSWDASSGEQVRLQCTHCHDPHSPAFPPMAPLPGPNTLRMGDPRADRAHHAEESPLLHWIRTPEEPH